MSTLVRLGIATLSLAPWTTPTATAQGGLTSRVDLSSFGAEGWDHADETVLSADGSIVAFSSRANTLVLYDTNDREDIFVHDRVTGVTERVSVSSAGVEGAGNSDGPAISDDGRYVAFRSYSTDLVPSIPPIFWQQIFLHDRQLGTTEAVSLNTTGGYANSYSWYPSVSGDGRHVTFASPSTDLVSGDVNGQQDVFVRDRLLGTTELVSVSSAGVQADSSSNRPMISADGRWVVFESLAANLVAGDTNGVTDCFVRDRLLGTTVRASLGDLGQESDQSCELPDISDDGKLVAFSSNSPWLVTGDGNGAPDVFVRDLGAATTELASVATDGTQSNDSSIRPFLSGDGRYVAFSSKGDNLTTPAGGISWDVFVRDRLLGRTTIASVSSDGVGSTESCSVTGISANGLEVGFRSEDPGLAPSSYFPLDWIKAYVHGIAGTPMPSRYCEAKQNSQGCWPTIAWSGAATLGGSDDFHVLAGNVLNQQIGILLWGTSGQKTLFSTAFLCVVSPQRTGPQSSGGNPPPSDCSGTYDFHASQAFLATNGFAAGDLLYTQFWSRDPYLPPSIASGLTQGLHLAIAP